MGQIFQWLINALKGQRITLKNHPLTCRYLKSIDHPPQHTGWGYKTSGLKAKSSGKDFLLFEDAFVRSIKPGYTGGVYGISVDRKGMIFDALGGCDLIDLIAQKTTTSPATAPLMERFRAEGISKYNWFCPQDISQFEPGVLLVDQSKGDASMEYGAIKPEDFTTMFEDALRDHPTGPIYIRTHPDQKHRAKKSCFSEAVLQHPRVILLPSEIPPKQCFELCHTVYVGTSLMGMEALIHGNTVITYGWGFYAGWGLTTDRTRHEVLQRPRQATLLELFEAAYVDYCHYYDPDLGTPTTLDAIITHISYHKAHWPTFEGSCDIVARDPWKKSVFSLYIQGPKNQSSFVSEVSTSSHKTYVWGLHQGTEGQIIRVEDGFLRSKGLGASFNPPLSLAFDDVGIYFDATAPSRLENLLNTIQITEDQKRESVQLMEFVRRHKLTKYNFPKASVTLPSEAHGKRTILVPGQVESDASIRLGSPRLKSNLELLTAVRENNADAFICFKPHPDLMASLRKGDPLGAPLQEVCDHIILEGDITSWVEVVDEVHTMTSTVGFEALIHQKKVTTYGMPFYAGWGLTTDHSTCDRRHRTLTIEELAYGALCEYPIYLNPNTGEFIPPLKAASLLAHPDYQTKRPNGLWRFALLCKKYYNTFNGR